VIYFKFNDEGYWTSASDKGRPGRFEWPDGAAVDTALFSNIFPPKAGQCVASNFENLVGLPCEGKIPTLICELAKQDQKCL